MFVSRREHGGVNLESGLLPILEINARLFEKLLNACDLWSLVRFMRDWGDDLTILQ